MGRVDEPTGRPSPRPSLVVNSFRLALAQGQDGFRGHLRTMRRSMVISCGKLTTRRIYMLAGLVASKRL